jgi:hypothetical protein
MFSTRLNRIAKQVQENFPKVNNLISFTREEYVKASLQPGINKDEPPDVSLRTEPMLTLTGI